MAALSSASPLWTGPLLALVAGALLLTSLAIYLPSRREPPRTLRMVSLSLAGRIYTASLYEWKNGPITS